MKCLKCGTELSDGVKFCKNCGVKIGDAQGNEKAFQEFVNASVQQSTGFQSAEELLNSRVQSDFVKICYGIPVAIAVLWFFLTIFRDGFMLQYLFVLIFLAFIVGYAAVHFVGGIRKNKYISRFIVKNDGKVDTDDLIRFLNEKLSYLSPCFNTWGYLRQKLMVGYILLDITSQSNVSLCTEYNNAKLLYVTIDISKDGGTDNCESKKYICNVQMRSPDVACKKYECAVKTAPILYAALVYYMTNYNGGNM